MSRGRLHECPASAAHSPGSFGHPQVHRPTHTHAKHANTCSWCASINTNGRLGRMCGRHRIFPPPFLAVRPVSVSRVQERGSKKKKKHDKRRAEAEKTDSQVVFKTTDGMKRKETGRFSGNWMRDLGEEGGRTVV